MEEERVKKAQILLAECIGLVKGESKKIRMTKLTGQGDGVFFS